jgi:hypothetical protein
MTIKQRQSVSPRLREMVKSNPKSVKISESEIAVPIDEQSNYSQTIQTHANAVVPATNGESNGAWIDCDGFDKMAVSMTTSSSSGNTGCYVHWSNDGTNIHGTETVLSPAQALIHSTKIVDVKTRYVRVVATNTHTTPITVNTWTYLKV